MSSIWRETPEGWSPITIPEMRPLEGHVLGIEGLRFVRHGQGGDRGIALLATRPVHVNGRPVLGGVRVLEHRDELLVGRLRYFYSAESTPLIVAYRGTEGRRGPTCPQCRGPLREGDMSVQCPGCTRWFHQRAADGDRPAKPCWTYEPQCRFCQHPTALDGAPAWRPDEEEVHAR